MKRTVVIVFVTVLLCRLGSAQVVIQPLNGEIQYQYQYQSYTSASFHSSTSSHNPMIDIGTSGSIFAPAIISFSLRSNLNLNNMSTSAPAYSVSNKQFLWNYFNLGLTIFRDLPVSASILLNDGVRQTSASTSQADLGGTRSRRQEESLRLMCHQLSFLPSMNVSVDRSHEWSLDSSSPIDNVNTNYLIDLSSSGQGGSINVSGSLSENTERYSGISSRLYTLLVHGVRNLESLQTLNYNINYNRFSDVTNIRGTASYVNASDKQFHYSSLLNSFSNSSPAYQTSQVSLAQSVQYIQSDNYRYGLGLSTSYEKDASSIGGDNHTTTSASTSGSIQHTDGFKNVNYSNSVNLVYSLTKLAVLQRTFTSGLSNGFHASLGGAGLSASDGVTYSQVNGDSSQSYVSNALNLDLSYAAVTLYDFQVQFVAALQAENRSGNLEQGYGNHRDVQLQWSVNSPLMYYYVPFTIMANGGENWFFGTVEGRTFSWAATFTSPQFFARNLMMSYRLSRTYDPTYQRQSIMHSIESRYQWRAIALSLRYEIYRLVSNQNALWFSISRPF